MKILIIEDEIELANSIAGYLTRENYLCEFANTLEESFTKIGLYDYDCILLDLSLPDGDGITILKHLKQLNKLEGIIIISARSAVEDKIVGLKIGADDYLIKPFHLAELSARIYSVIRRKQLDNSNVMTYQELTINFLAKAVWVSDQLVVLTKKEFDLLVYFIVNKNKVLSKSAIAEHLSGEIADMLDNHDFVYAHIKNLKKKLYQAGCKQYIKTVYSTGYKWDDI